MKEQDKVSEKNYIKWRQQLIRKRVQRMMLTEPKGRMNELNKKCKKETKYFKQTNQSRRIHLKQ